MTDEKHEELVEKIDRQAEVIEELSKHTDEFGFAYSNELDKARIAVEEAYEYCTNSVYFQVHRNLGIAEKASLEMDRIRKLYRKAEPPKEFASVKVEHEDFMNGIDGMIGDIRSQMRFNSTDPTVDPLPPAKEPVKEKTREDWKGHLIKGRISGLEVEIQSMKVVAKHLAGDDLDKATIDLFWGEASDKLGIAKLKLGQERFREANEYLDECREALEEHRIYADEVLNRQIREIRERNKKVKEKAK